MNAKASHITNDAARIYGSRWKTKLIKVVVISCEKRVPEGSTRNATFATVKWSLPGQVVVKELNGQLLMYVPNVEPDAVAEVAPPDNEDNLDDVAAQVHAVPKPVADQLPVEDIGVIIPAPPPPIPPSPSPAALPPTPPPIPPPELSSDPPTPPAPAQYPPKFAQIAHMHR